MSTATDFWQENQVAEAPRSYEESVNQLLARSEQFPLLKELMPVAFPGKLVLDFGCGPGHDTIQFLNHGATHVYYADISWKALAITSERLKLHGLRSLASPLFADDELPVVDHVHCAGVLHHMHDPIGALLRLRRISPSARVMVYDGKKSTHSDSLVPITEWWTPKEFVKMCHKVGWEAVYQGSYPCASEWRPNCWAACFALS